MSTTTPVVTIRTAEPDDVPHILAFIRELAEYEKLTHEVNATQDLLQQTLFGPRPFAEALIGCVNGRRAKVNEGRWLSATVSGGLRPQFITYRHWRTTLELSAMWRWLQMAAAIRHSQCAEDGEVKGFAARVGDGNAAQKWHGGNHESHRRRTPQE